MRRTEVQAKEVPDPPSISSPASIPTKESQRLLELSVIWFLALVVLGFFHVKGTM